MERKKIIRVVVSDDEFLIINKKAALNAIKTGKSASLSDLLRTLALETPVELLPIGTTRTKAGQEAVLAQ